MVEGLIGSFSILTVLLLIVGFLLIGFEFIMPGFSLPGILGTICLGLSVIITAKSLVEALVMIIGILIILGIMLVFVLTLFAKGKVAAPLILTEEQTKHKGYISSKDLEYLLGKEGIAQTDLRPTGIGDFDGVSFDVVSENQYILKDTRIIISKVQGSKLIVRVKK